MRPCWICQELADSSEHKIKRSDLVRVHGSGNDFREANLNFLTSENEIKILQGPNSTCLKYEKVLCAKCNNERTQRFDRAYDHFIEYIENKKNKILSCRQIDFREVFGENWPESQRDLFKYFAKAFGCRIANMGVAVPADIAGLMWLDQFQTALWVCVAVNEDECATPDKDQNKLKLGHVITNGVGAFATAYFYRWIVFTYWHGWGPFGPAGSRWCADLQYLHLGSYSIDLSQPEIPGADGKWVRWPGF